MWGVPFEATKFDSGVAIVFRGSFLFHRRECYLNAVLMVLVLVIVGKVELRCAGLSRRNASDGAVVGEANHIRCSRMASARGEYFREP